MDIEEQSRWSSIRDHFLEDVTRSWADILLLTCCFLSGLVDSAVFNVWGCFSSMQTGNTVYLGLGIAGQPLDSPYRWVKSLTSILSFLFGCFLFARLCRWMSPLRRSTICGSFFLQALLCFIAATLVELNIVPQNAGNLLPRNFIVLLPLALLSFQSAGQIVMSRFLSYNDVPTVVLTSTYCDLMFDPHLLTTGVTENSKRNRRFFAISGVLLGAMTGGFLTRSGSIEGVLWIAGSAKVVISVAWVFWKADNSVRLE